MYYELESCNCYMPLGIFYYINKRYHTPCFMGTSWNENRNIRSVVNRLPKGTSDIKFQPFILLV